ncbi:MAG TPA: hypothetical protein VI278_10645 [Nitrososphaeraceae archaeon]
MYYDVTLADIPEKLDRSKYSRILFNTSDLNGLHSIYEKCSRLLGPVDFYERLLKLIMYSMVAYNVHNRSERDNA